MKEKWKKIYPTILTILIAVGVVAAIYGYQVVYREQQLYKKYQEAFELYKKGEYAKSEKILQTISTYKGVSVLLCDIQYQKGLIAFEEGDYVTARDLFLKVSDYQDSQDYIKETTYLLGIDAYTVQDYDTAKGYFEEIKDYKETNSYLEEIAFIRLKEVFAQEFYSEAEECIFEIPDYPGVEPYAIVVLEKLGQLSYEAQQYERASEMYRIALEYSSWVDIYEGMTAEEKADYAPIAGEVDFKQRLKNIKEEKELTEREYQAVLCTKELVKYYENNMVDIAVLTQVDEIRFAWQTYSNNAKVPLIMISYKETVDKKQNQAYAAYNETELYGICHSLKMEEIDKSNSEELQANLKIAGLWDDKETVKIDMERIRKAMGWE